MIEHKIIEAWNTKNYHMMRSIYGKEVTVFDPLINRIITGDKILGYAQAVFTSFPDHQFKVVSIAHGKNVTMIEWIQCGTNTGPIIGRPPTNKYIEIPAVTVLKLEEGRLLSQYDYWDMKKLTEELFAS